MLQIAVYGGYLTINVCFFWGGLVVTGGWLTSFAPAADPGGWESPANGGIISGTYRMGRRQEELATGAGTQLEDTMHVVPALGSAHDRWLGGS